MFFVRVTVHDHQELDCRTFSFTQTFRSTDNLYALSPEELGKILAGYRDDAVAAHGKAYPRGRSFSLPIVEMEVAPSEELLKGNAKFEAVA
jgi:hypothetical protein